MSIRSTIAGSAAILFAVSTIISAADSGAASVKSTFADESALWHKNAVITCGMIKSPKAPDVQEVAKRLADLSVSLDNLTQKYKSNPPANYKNDPLWGSYFDDLADNLAVIKYFSEKQEYRIAAKNCSVFCQTFLRMHKNNETVDLTDMLFSLNMQLKLTTDISNTGNAEGAMENIALINKIMDHVSKKVKTSNDTNLQKLFLPVEKTTQDWLKAIEQSDPKTAKSLYASFMPDFQKIFMASL